MARDESDREDLWGEATALVERVELEFAGAAEPLVAGFRRDGALSLFFGADPVYQFNAAGELRRAFVAGRILKAGRGKLASLQRRRTATEVQLVRHDLSAAESTSLLAELSGRLALVRQALEANEFRILRSVPEPGNVIARLAAALRSLPATPIIARSPRVG